MKLPISVTVLTGFLGSGKTTLLKALLQHPDMARTAVNVNEFGEVGIDDALIAEAEEDVVLLPSGCVCCAVRGDLIEALNKLCARMTKGEMAPVDRVVIETTGLADPAPIAHTLMTEEDLFRVFQLDAIVTTVDAAMLAHDNSGPAVVTVEAPIAAAAPQLEPIVTLAQAETSTLATAANAGAALALMQQGSTPSVVQREASLVALGYQPSAEMEQVAAKLLLPLQAVNVVMRT